MLTCLIVDDEQLMRRGIQHAIEWETFGIHEVLTAANGREALEAIERQNIDIILTDVRMPGIDGLELSRIVSERWSHVKIVIISGYDDFHYAKRSIAYGVSDYILKPIDGKSLSDTLQKIVQEIRLEKAKAEEQDFLSKRLDKTVGVAKQRILREMLSGEMDGRELVKYAELLGLNDLPLRKNVITLMKICSFQEKSSLFRDSGLLHFAVQNILQEIVKAEGGGELIDIRLGSMCLLISMDQDGDDAEAERIVHSMMEAVNRYLRVQTLWGIGSVSNGFSGLQASNTEAIRALSYRWFASDKKIFRVGDVPWSKAMELPGKETEMALSNQLRFGDVTAFKEHLNQAFELLLSGTVFEPESVGLYFLKMADIAVHVIKERKLSPNEQLEANIRDVLYYSDTIEEVVKQIKEHFGTILSFIRQQRKQYSKAILDVIDYLNDHFHHDVTLADAANHVSMNRTYLSYLFVQETGKNFSDFLLELRMEKAKELLHTSNMKSYEVADAVGYKDARHFGQMFRKATGLTPKEYRKTGIERP